MAETWVRIYRKSIENGWLTNPKLWTFWCYCLLKASRFEHMQLVGSQQVPLKPGQFVFGRKSTSKDLEMSEQSVRTCLENLIKLGNVTTKPTNKYTVVTIANWEYYQADKSKPTNKSTSDQPGGNQEVTTNKKEERKKEDKTKDITLFSEYARKEINLTITNKGQAEELIKAYGLEVMKDAIKRARKYWDRNRSKTRKFFYKKKWARFFENISIFLSDHELADRINEEIKWLDENKLNTPAKKIEVCKPNYTIEQFYKAGRHLGKYDQMDKITDKRVVGEYHNYKIFKVPEDKI